MDTQLIDISNTDLLASRCLVERALGSGDLKWRHHGAGMIQAYLTPRLRIHVWHPELELPGMAHSGAIHDHRFDLVSTVLLGSLTNRECRFSHDRRHAFTGNYACKAVNFDVYTVECATSGKTTNPTKVSSKSEPVFYKDRQVPEGARYFFPKKAFHQSMPAAQFVITMVHKLNQEDFLARLLVPEGTTPIHAFQECNGTHPAHHTVIPTPDAPKAREFYNCHMTPERMAVLAAQARTILADKIGAGG